MQRRLTVVDDPSPFCSHWHASPRAANASPIWRVQQASRQAGRQIALRPTYPVRCSRWHGTDWRGSWRMTGNTSQCTDLNPGPDWCVLIVKHAAVLESGLVVNATHRFNLAPSHIGINAQWERDGLSTMPPHNRPGTPRRLYTFRQQYADNPGHSIIQALPLLALALPSVLRNEAHVLASSPLFAALARLLLPADRVILSSGAVGAKAVHVVVFRPPFAVLQHVFPSGIAARLRPAPAVPAVGREAEETLLYLSRSPQGPSQGQNQRAARPGVRTFDNEAELLSRTNALLQRPHLRVLKLEVFERFRTLKRQSQSFGRARLIVGPHGTAWSGLAFARPGVAVVEWCGRRDSWSLTEYLGLGASYYQLHPHWRIDPGVPSCASSQDVDDCPWFLTASDLGLYTQLLSELLNDGGASLRGASRASPRVARASNELARSKRLLLPRR